ncbi:hypothetical protein F5B18DRAFT_411643 [Nemania serpens]|nr:hypothetical protein F5B18DRAFT_411643 [Nemania serpens]
MRLWKRLCGPMASAALVAGLLLFPLLASFFGWLKADYFILRRTIVIHAASASSMKGYTRVTCRRAFAPLAGAVT